MSSGALRRLAVTVLSMLAGPAAFVCVIAPASPASAAVDDVGAPVRPAVEAPLVGDDHPGLLDQRRRDARDSAIHGVLNGVLTPSAGGGVVELPGPAVVAGPAVIPGVGSASTPYADLEVSGTDRALTLLVDFGPGDYRDRTWNGPVHRPSPASAPVHYDHLLFGTGRSSLQTYLSDQSGGRYALQGSAQDWVGLPYNAAYYGANDCNGGECPERVASFAADAADAFVAAFHARDPVGDLAAFLAPYDRRDRYDADRDGDFDEPDGYVDHLMIVFAGGAERSPAESDLMRGGFGSIAGDDIGSSGPAGSPFGGHELGSSGMWADSFTALPENADLGTAVHGFAHDLGLSDLADPAGRADIDTSVQFWSPMAAGATLGAPPARRPVGAPSSGSPTPPGSIDGAQFAPPGPVVPDLLAVERLQLGWLEHAEVQPGQTVSVELSGESSSLGVDAAIVPLGDLPYVAPTAAPAVGGYAFVAANGPSASAVLQLPLTGSETTVSWRQWVDTEPVFDPMRVQALVGGSWVDVAPPVTGRAGWSARTAALPTGATALRYVYSTDAVSTGTGVLLDEIAVGTGAAEGAEAGIPTGWVATGWAAGPGRTVQAAAPAFYVAERRDLAGYDNVLSSAPFVADPREGSAAVDRFGYDDGVLLTFWDGRAPDNAVSAHPGSGRVLVVDARPEPVQTVSRAIAPAGLHPFDAAFGLSWRRGFALDAYSVTASGAIRAERVRVRAQPPVPTFDDTDARYAEGSAGQPRLPGRGVTMTVTDEAASSSVVQFGRG